MARAPSLPSTHHPDRPQSKDLKVLKRAFGFVLPYWRRVLIAMTALLVTVGATLGLGQGLRAVIDAGFAAGDQGALDRALMLLVGLAVLMAIGTYVRFYFMSWLGERVVADLRNAVFARVIAMHPAFFEVTKTGEVMSRITTDTALLQSIVGSSASMALRNGLMLIGGLVMLAVTNGKLTALVLLVVPLVVVPIVLIGRRVRRLSRQSQDRVADVGAFAEESVNAIRTLQAFTHEAADRTRFGGEVKGAFDTALTRIRLRAGLMSLVILLVFMAIAFILWIGGSDVMAGRISGGELSAFVFYATIVAFSVGVISEVMGELQRAAGATERLVELLEAEPEILSPPEPTPLPEPARGEVRFETIRFHYPSRPDIAALEDFSLTVQPGETVALVGPSGAGKSTVFQLLLRFYDPQHGCIRLDGIDIREAGLETLRGRIGIVPQDPVIFSTTARENIRYGAPDASDAAVEAAAKAARADEFIRALPDGYDSFLGEKGVRLSGGQRQRLSIARAILRDPSVLLLDEATSALDAENERLVQEALNRLMQGRTTLIIAHRLATIVNADRIIVMDQGRAIASGKHHELVERDPLYARLARLQFTQPEAAE